MSRVRIKLWYFTYIERRLKRIVRQNYNYEKNTSNIYQTMIFYMY